MPRVGGMTVVVATVGVVGALATMGSLRALGVLGVWDAGGVIAVVHDVISVPAVDGCRVVSRVTHRAALKPRRRRELATTKTDEKAMAAPAIIGLSRPAAASGSAATL